MPEFGQAHFVELLGVAWAKTDEQQVAIILDVGNSQIEVGSDETSA